MSRVIRVPWVLPPAVRVGGRGLASGEQPAGGRFQLSETLLGALLPPQGSWGPLQESQGAERAPEEAGSGGGSGPSVGSFLALPAPANPPPPLVSSLTRRQQVLEGPRPQSPCGHCGPEAGPHHPCPLHTHCSGHRGPQHSTAHRWVPRHSASRHPARSVLSPCLCLCAALGAGGSAPGRAGAWLLVQRTRGLHSHQSARPRGPQAVWTHLSLGPSQGSLLVLECSSSCPCKVLLRAPRPARPRGQGDPGGGGPWQ